MGSYKDYRKSQSNNTYNTLWILSSNGWKWHHYADDPVIQMDSSEDYDSYTLDILGEYTSKVRAVVSSHDKHLCVDGHFGVLWLDIVEYECKPPYSSGSLEDMQFAIELAEDNLLTIGMPFTPGYEFHGNIEEKVKVNNELREFYNLNELEKKAGY